MCRARLVFAPDRHQLVYLVLEIGSLRLGLSVEDLFHVAELAQRPITPSALARARRAGFHVLTTQVAEYPLAHLDPYPITKRPERLRKDKHRCPEDSSFPSSS